jgi:hypothetical protein
VNCRRLVLVFLCVVGTGLLLGGCSGDKLSETSSATLALPIATQAAPPATIMVVTPPPAGLPVATLTPRTTATAAMPAVPVAIPPIPTLLPALDQPYTWLRIEDPYGLHDRVAVRWVKHQTFEAQFELARWWNAALEDYQDDFVLKLADGVYLTFPPQIFRRAYWQGDHHVVTLADNEDIEGLLDFTLETPDYQYYDLSAALTVVLTRLPGTVAVKENPAPPDQVWELHVSAPVDVTYHVTNPRFTYSFYTTAGWAIGGGDSTALGRESFFIRTSQNDFMANPADFQQIAFSPLDEHQTQVTVQGASGEELTGQLVFIEEDSAGVHEAHTWILALDRTDLPMKVILGNATYTLRKVG